MDDTDKLRSAVRKGKKALVEKMIKKDVGILERDGFILDHAIKGGHTPIVKLLLERGVKVGWGDLVRAAESGNMEMVKLILERSDINDVRGFDLSKAARGAARGGNLNIVKFFIDKGANDYAGALVGAAEGGHMSVFKYILKMDPALYSNAYAVNKAYTGAADGGHTHILAFLKKPKFNCSSINYERALNGSAHDGHVNVVKMVAPKVKLWDYALVDASYSYKYKQGHLPVVQYLVSHAKRKKLSKEAIVKAYNITKNQKIKKLLRANALVKGLSLKLKMKSYKCVIQLVYVPLQHKCGKRRRARQPPNPSTSEIYKYFSEKGRLGEFVKDIVGYDPTYKNIRGVAMDKSLNIEFTVDVDALSWRQASAPTNEKEVAADIAFANQSFADGCYEGSSDNECHYPDADDKECAIGEFAYKVLSVKQIK